LLRDCGMNQRRKAVAAATALQGASQPQTMTCLKWSEAHGRLGSRCVLAQEGASLLTTAQEVNEDVGVQEMNGYETFSPRGS